MLRLTPILIKEKEIQSLEAWMNNFGQVESKMSGGQDSPFYLTLESKGPTGWSIKKDRATCPASPEIEVGSSRMNTQAIIKGTTYM